MSQQVQLFLFVTVSDIFFFFRYGWDSVLLSRYAGAKVIKIPCIWDLEIISGHPLL